MEIIRLSGYTEDEKVEIAKRHLINKQVKSHGLKKNEWSISDSAVRDLIRYYTREAGVRNLERELANLTRKAIKNIMVGDDVKIVVTRKNLEKYAGIKRFRYGEIENDDLIGVVTGLAWTEVGGELLSIEAVMMPGKGKMTITGKLGDVMQESIQAAKSFVQSRALDFGIIPPMFTTKDIHVHVPEGATPKDGPSAGVGMVTSIVSVLSGIAVRKDVAMTGEITLRGRVLPIGGLKEKLLAALRGGIKTVLIPHENEKDLADIPDNVKEGMTIIPVSSAEEVLKHALVSKLTPAEWTKEMEAAALASARANNINDVVH
jgi:ATP-dependent Lon protease